MRLSYKQIVSRVGLQLVSALVAVVQQVMLVPFFLAYWSAELYRSWLIIVSISAVLIVLDLGLHPLTYLRLQRVITNNSPITDKRRAIGDSFRAYGLVLACAVPVAGVFAFLLPIVGVLGLSGAPEGELRFALLFMLGTGLATVASSCLTAMVRAANAVNALALLGIAQTLMTAVALFAGLLAGLGVAGLAAVFFAIQLLVVLLALIICGRKVPNFGITAWNDARESPIRSLRSARSYIIPVSGDLLILHVPTLVMGVIGTPAAGVVLFTLTRVFASFIRQVASLATNPFGPEIGHLWILGRHEDARNTLLLCLGVAGCGVGTLAGYFIVYQGSIFEIWTLGQYHVDLVISACLLGSAVVSFPAVAAFAGLLHTARPLSVTVTKVVQLALLTAGCFVAGAMTGVRGVSATVFLAELAVVAIPLTVAMRRAFAIPTAYLFAWVVGPFTICSALSLLSAEAAVRIIPPVGLSPFIFSSLVWLPVPLAAVLLGLLLLHRANQGKRTK